MHSTDVVVVGAGISGLAAAYELQARGVDAQVLEIAPRAGGVILTERIDRYTIDAGPDSLLVQKPAALDLCREIGLAGRLIPTRTPRTAFVLKRGALHPLPEPATLGIPRTLGALLRTRLLSARGKIRLALERARPAPPRAPAADESIASFFGRRFGPEVVEYLAEPLLAGIHAGDVERLSMRALFPALVEAEERHGSVLRAFRSAEPTPPDGLFRSLPGGVGELVSALTRALPAGAVRLGASADAIEGGGPYTVRLGSGARLEARAVILAVAAYHAARLLQSRDPELAALCRAIPYTSTATVVLAYPRDAVGHPLRGSGFVVPRAERNVRLLAATWISSKWPDRAPSDVALMRAFVGGARDPAALELDDPELVALAHGALTPLLRIGRPPAFSRVYRWERRNPQHEVGHLDRVAAIERRLERSPGLYLTGSAFRGVGIPDCIADARRVAAAAAEAIAAERR